MKIFDIDKVTNITMHTSTGETVKGTDIIFNPPDSSCITVKGVKDTTILNKNNYVDLDALRAFKELLYEELFSHPTYEHKCANCGGTVEMDIDRHIFKCPYCQSVYAIGTYMTKG